MSGILDLATQGLAAVGGVAGLGALFRIGIDRRTAKANASHAEADADRAGAAATRAVTDTAVGLLDPLRESVKFLTDELSQSRAEASALRADVAALHTYVNLLMDVIEAAGLPAPPRPGPLVSEQLTQPTGAAPARKPRSTRTRKKENE